MIEDSDKLIIDALIVDFNNIKYFFVNRYFEKNSVVRLCNSLLTECLESKNKMKTFKNRKRVDELSSEIEEYRNYIENTFEDYGV
jgi:hypothetical protein